MDRLELLDRMRRTPALGELPLSQLARLADSGELCSFEPGERLLGEDDLAREFYLLVEGEVSIQKRMNGDHTQQKIARRSAPDWLGESAVLDTGARSASVLAPCPGGGSRNRNDKP